MGCGSSQSIGAASYSPSANEGSRVPSASADRLGIFSCHLHLAPPASPSTITVTGSSTGKSQLELKQKSGKSTTYEADCILDSTGASSGDMASYYSEKISPIIKACCINDTASSRDEERNALLLTLGGQGSGKTTALYGLDNGSNGGGIVQFICKDLLDICESERTLLTLSLISVPTGKTESGAYDCLANAPSSSAAADGATKQPLLATAADAKCPFEIEVESVEDVTKVLIRGRSALANAGTSSHSLLVATIRSLNEYGNVDRCCQIKVLDLQGDVPSHTSSNSASGKSGAKGGRGGGRGGRKGGRGWSSYDTRKGATSSDEDHTVRTVRRVVDFLSRRFKNVPYHDSILTTLVQSELEGRYSTKEVKSAVCLVCIKGKPDAGDGKEVSMWHDETAHVLEFMEKIREITVLAP